MKHTYTDMDEKLFERELTREQVYSCNIFSVDKLTVELPNGVAARRDVVRHNGAAAVIPVDDERNITLVRQFRIALNCITLEIPAGKLDSKDEDPKCCVARELKEETGLTAGEITHLTDIVGAIGFCNERVSIYMARDLSSGTAVPDDDEFLEIVKMPLDKAMEMAMAGEFVDAKTTVAVLMADRLLK